MTVPIIGQRRLRIAVGTPCYRRQVDVMHVQQIMRLMLACSPQSGFELVGHTYTDTCNVDRSRNLLVTYALKAKCDWLLMVDADTHHVAEADTVRMIKTGETYGAAVIAAPVKMRRRSDGYNVRRREGGQLAKFEGWRGEVGQVDAIGTAFFAVNCGWIRQRWPEQPWFQTLHLPGETPTSIGEDISFCHEVGKREGLILCDGRFEPRHEGADYPS